MESSELAASAANVDRYRPLYFLLNLGTLFVGMLIWSTSWLDVSQFHLETWGALAYEAGAATWGSSMSLASLLCLLGLIEPPRRWMVTVGALAHCAVLVALAVSAVITGGDTAVAIFALCVLLPLHGWLALAARGGVLHDHSR